MLSGYLYREKLDPLFQASVAILFAVLLVFFPGLAVVILLSVFVMGPIVTSLPLGDYFADAGTWKYLSLIVLAPISNVLPGVFDANPLPYAVNGSLWTLRYEFLAYLLTPLLYAATKKLCGGRKLVFAVVLAVLV